MVKDDLNSAERQILLGYAPRHARTGLAAILALDDQLSTILRTTREPMVGQMRLTWWHGALTALDTAPAPAEPVLQAIASHVVPKVSGQDLARLVEGWEELLDPEPLDADRLDAFADHRGGGLFRAMAQVAGAAASDPVDVAGRGWALADLAAHVRDPAAAVLASDRAAPLLCQARTARWSRAGRAIGAMAHLAAMPDASPPRRTLRILWHRLTGR
ncbi:hypothetical protein ASE86_08485 [Sphingomonas sp. Leaf33]|uniref:squalene/phytoene synthase family protein n=1 Tax=Sphingomonas sp. Leaf33 TaxID=1736215 RepID=UPI0006F988D9|nr:squalene/phytoene synthase family protein [Sphingomonas sp. Leaf33]KQN26177.1 hypothetical protein ASE86_08485 [Sphingomonas sp. Leaf33]